MVDSSSRPSFTELCDTLEKWQHEPARFIAIEKDKEKQQLMTDMDQAANARSLMRSLLDTSNVENMVDPDEYFNHTLSTPTTSSPMSPSKPVSARCTRAHSFIS